MDKIKSIKIKVFGLVQGVFFRAESQKEAVKLGLKGVSRNLGDGTVEIIAEGEEEKLKKLLRWCYKGSDLADVEKIDFIWQNPSGNFSSFEIE